MSTHNICFCGEIRKIFTYYTLLFRPVLTFQYSLFIHVFRHLILFDLGLMSLSTSFSLIAMVSGCGRELNAHF